MRDLVNTVLPLQSWGPECGNWWACNSSTWEVDPWASWPVSLAYLVGYKPVSDSVLKTTAANPQTKNQNQNLKMNKQVNPNKQGGLCLRNGSRDHTEPPHAYIYTHAWTAAHIHVFVHKNLRAYTKEEWNHIICRKMVEDRNMSQLN